MGKILEFGNLVSWKKWEVCYIVDIEHFAYFPVFSCNERRHARPLGATAHQSCDFVQVVVTNV